MKALKYIGLSLLTLVLLFTVFGWFQNPQFSVSRTTLVHAKMPVVFEQFNSMENRISWSPWERQDSTMVTTLGTTRSGVGAEYSWTSSNSGNGSLRYTEVVPEQLIQSEVFFGMGEDEEPTQELIIFSQSEDGVKVTWEIHMDMGGNPFSRLMGRYMDDMLGPTLENGLASMKEISENAPQFINTTGVDIQVSVVESKPYIGILDSCSTEEMEQKISAAFGALGQFIHQNNLNIVGYSQISYHKWEPPTKVVFEPRFIVSEIPNISNENVHSGSTFGGNVIKATHVGSYESSGKVWMAMDQFVEDNQLTVVGSPWEEYENNPQTEPDTAKLITHIYYPIQ